MIVKKLLFMLGFLLVASGCTQNGDASRSVEDRNGNRFVSNPSTSKEQSEVQDNYQNTNQNPNFLYLSNERPDLGTDIDKARDVVKRTNEYRPGSIWINGNKMWVTVYKKGMLSPEQKIAIAAQVRKKLIEALPRYDIHVKVKEDRT